MGAINVSPESFYTGSIARSVDDAVGIARRMVEEGADLIDVGGMSTAPYKRGFVPESIEAERTIPVVRTIKEELGVLISIDTTRASVAEEALDSGADLINDVSGCMADSMMSKVAASTGTSMILATRDDEAEIVDGPLETVRHNLRRSLEICAEAGVRMEDIVIDPGIGFYRDVDVPWYEWDTTVLAGLWRLLVLLRPICVGVSRKSFIGEILGLERPEDRLIGSRVAEVVAVVNGAHIIRTHDVAETIQAVRMAERMRRRSIVVNHGGIDVVDFSGGLEMSDVELLAELLGSEPEGVRTMSPKGDFRILLVRGLPRVLALILKQEMLASGGELATPRETLLGGLEPVDVLLMGTVRQCRGVSRRLSKMRIPTLEAKDLPTPTILAELLRSICG